MVVTLAQELETSFIRSGQNVMLGGYNRPYKYFEWIRLQKLCMKFGLEASYQIYAKRITRNYLMSFMRIHLCFAFLHSAAVLLGYSTSSYYMYDSVVYITGAVMMCLSLVPYFIPYLVDNFPAVPYIVSVTASLIMVVTDGLPSIIGYIINNDIICCSYTGYTISAIYLFMPAQSILFAVSLGVIASSLYCMNSTYISFVQIENNQTQFEIRFFIPELLFLVGINIIGTLFRIRHEFNKRKIFLTKSLHIEENLLLKNAKDHEHNLLLTIIPEKIAKKIEEDIKISIKRSQYFKLFRSSTTTDTGRKLFIEPHYNVSVLFADVVNYTHLTTTLDVKSLVETLHELFQRFDSACNEFNCMRIKFLGDCYYCVAGVPQTHPYHALCSTELGRAIIRHIEEVREIRSLDIGMRIGIHSGNILSGIIGAAKWQYDIWSKDVDIASCLEHTGMPGRVHITEATLNLIEGYYDYEDGTAAAKNNPFLQKENIRTFLLLDPSEYMTTSSAWRSFRNQFQRDKLFDSGTDLIANAQSAMIGKMHKGKKMDYPTIRAKANAEITRKVITLPVCKLSLKEQCFTRLPRLAAHQMEDFKANQNISVCCLWYENWHWESMFNKERDEFFKMSVLGSILALYCVMGMQAANKTFPHTNASAAPQWCCRKVALHFVGVESILVRNVEDTITLITLNTISFIYSIFILLTCWFRTASHKLHAYPFYRPTNKVARFFYRTSINLENSWPYRTLVYATLVLCLLSAAFVHLITCNEESLENDDDLIHEFITGGRRVLCFNSWAVTNSVSLCLAVIMSFSHIPHCLSFTVAVLITMYYAAVIFSEFPVVYESSIITNRSIRTEYSHMWTCITILFIYQLMNRHLVFISRIGAYTKWNVDKKRKDAHLTNESIKILLHNILPSHVVNIYLSKRLRNEPYYEQHEFVAVIFATVIYTQSSSIELRLLNEIICDFDEVLNYYKGAIKVEKIKVANWSYMAACGFNVFTFKPRRSTKSFSTIFREATSSIRGMSTNLDVIDSMYNVYRRSSSVPNPLAVESDSSETDEDIADTDESVEEYDEKELEQTDEWKERQRMKVVNVMTHFGLDLLRSLEAFNTSNQLARGEDEPPIMLRIGISCGEVMAGVVGSSQAHYDIWGNAVNMASRMDSTGVPGRIQVTSEAAEMLKNLNIGCTFRGMTFVKGRGEIPTYFVEVTSDMNFKTISTNESVVPFR